MKKLLLLPLLLSGCYSTRLMKIEAIQSGLINASFNHAAELDNLKSMNRTLVDNLNKFSLAHNNFVSTGTAALLQLDDRMKKEEAESRRQRSMRYEKR